MSVASRFPDAKKSLGQNFLHDVRIAARIVDALEIGPEDRVLEIGPGPGTLTSLIARARPRLLCLLEKDRNLAFIRREAAAGCQVQTVLGDALAFPWQNLGEKSKADWKIIGNLPYNIASPLMWEIFSRCRHLGRAVFMLQKEVGERVTALPGTRAYGALSVWLQSFITARRLLTVSPGAFVPRPKVDSVVLVFAPGTSWPAGDLKRFASFLRLCFQQRRKQLGTILRGQLNERMADALQAAGLSLSSRPEEIPPSLFQELSSAWEGGGGKNAGGSGDASLDREQG